MKEYDVVIAGAGAAGLIASISAAKLGMKVLLLEKMDRPGRKILITGKGRCNVTNAKDWNEFSKHIYPNSGFFKHAFKSFSNVNLIQFLNEIGLETTVERGERIYPASGNSKDVVKALVDKIELLGVNFLSNSRLSDVEVNDSLVCGISYENSGRLYNIKTRSLIVTTGGLSYPLTGSDGDGYKIAEKLGIAYTKLRPSLTALKPVNYNSSLVKLVLKNINVKLVICKDVVQEEFGDAEFTNNGFEGPIGLKISRKAVKALSEGNKVSVIVDLKPALTYEQLLNRVEREFNNSSTISLNFLLKRLLPGQLIPCFIDELRFVKTKVLSKSLPGEIYKVIDLIKCWRIDISSYTGFERCVVTAGGISLEELVSKSMASKKIENLFFAGEIIDLDGDTGGFNLQIAFSTGFLAGKSAAYLIEKSKRTVL